MRVIAPLILFIALFGCASYDGSGLKPGISTTADVVQLMGTPAMRWNGPGGGEVLAFPRGPAGYHTFMVITDASGRLLSLENVLETKHFAKLRAGMSQDEVLRTLGPPQPQWTIYFKARDELVWEWRFCNEQAEPARFYALFDQTKGTLRTTMSSPESLSVPLGRDRRGWCSG